MRRLVNGLLLASVALLFLVSIAAAQDQAQKEKPQSNQTPAQTQSQTEAEGPAPSIVIDEMRHDMGNVFEADNYKYAFKVKNVGEADLEIKNVKPG
ncbi:MAG: hypothetical protein P8181_06870 [bacterium]